MKLRSTTPVSTSFTTRATLVAASVLMIAATPIAMSLTANADKYDEQIAALQKDIDQFTAQANKLGKQRQTYENQLSKLNNEKAQIQAKIDISEARAKKLAKDIQESKDKIAANRSALGDTINDMYIDGKISTIEMLASSNNIGDYVDKQAYQASISDTLTDTINTINELKAKLEAQKKDVERVIADQKNARNALAAKEAEKSKLIAQTRGQEGAYQKLSSEAASQQRKVQEQQQAAIIAALNQNGGGSLGGGGSLASYASWLGVDCYVDGNALSYSIDSLGYGCNQCVSYTAYMMIVKTGYAPSYWGNAGMWPASAANAGFTVSSTPRSNSLGVMAGSPGHIVYVHSYNSGSSTVNISQYNEWLPNGGWGKYSTRNGVGAGTYDYYIYL